jgi:putative ABC transport system substrate-binding protein
LGLVERNLDALVTITTPATHAAVTVTSRVPIVFTMVADPVGSGFIASLPRPGGNVTGLTFVPELDFFSKQLELLREIVPGIPRVAILWVATNPVHADIVAVTTAAATRLGLEARSRPVRTLAEIEQVFTDLAGSGPSAALVIADFLFYVHRQGLADLATKARVPVMYGAREQVEAGGLIAYAPNLLAMQRRAASYVDKILRGVKPADLPAERPSRFVLVINRRAARDLGLTIPPAVLLRADEIIE